MPNYARSYDDVRYGNKSSRGADSSFEERLLRWRSAAFSESVATRIHAGALFLEKECDLQVRFLRTSSPVTRTLYTYFTLSYIIVLRIRVLVIVIQYLYTSLYHKPVPN